MQESCKGTHYSRQSQEWNPASWSLMPSPAHCVPLSKGAVGLGQQDMASAKVMLLLELASGLLIILA